MVHTIVIIYGENGLPHIRTYGTIRYLTTGQRVLEVGRHVQVTVA